MSIFFFSPIRTSLTKKVLSSPSGEKAHYIYMYILYLFLPQDVGSQIDSQKSMYNAIHKLAEDLLKDERVNDTAAVNLILRNMDDNWTALEDLLGFR